MPHSEALDSYNFGVMMDGNEKLPMVIRECGPVKCGQSDEKLFMALAMASQSNRKL